PPHKKTKRFIGDFGTPRFQSPTVPSDLRALRPCDALPTRKSAIQQVGNGWNLRYINGEQSRAPINFGYAPKEDVWLLLLAAVEILFRFECKEMLRNTV